jgi:hypothetical protein
MHLSEKDFRKEKTHKNQMNNELYIYKHSFCTLMPHGSHKKFSSFILKRHLYSDVYHINLNEIFVTIEFSWNICVVNYCAEFIKIIDWTAVNWMFVAELQQIKMFATGLQLILTPLWEVSLIAWTNGVAEVIIVDIWYLEYFACRSGSLNQKNFDLLQSSHKHFNLLQSSHKHSINCSPVANILICCSSATNIQLTAVQSIILINSAQPICWCVTM